MPIPRRRRGLIHARARRQSRRGVRFRARVRVDGRMRRLGGRRPEHRGTERRRNGGLHRRGRWPRGSRRTGPERRGRRTGFDPKTLDGIPDRGAPNTRPITPLLSSERRSLAMESSPAKSTMGEAAARRLISPATSSPRVTPHRTRCRVRRRHSGFDLTSENRIDQLRPAVSSSRASSSTKILRWRVEDRSPLARYHPTV